MHCGIIKNDKQITNLSSLPFQGSKNSKFIHSFVHGNVLIINPIGIKIWISKKKHKFSFWISQRCNPFSVHFTENNAMHQLFYDNDGTGTLVQFLQYLNDQLILTTMKLAKMIRRKIMESIRKLYLKLIRNWYSNQT